MDWKDKINELESLGLSIRVEKNDEILFESREPMLKPLFTCYKLFKEKMAGSTVIDKVIGKAAAYICILSKVGKVYSPLVSESAEAVLAENGIELKALRVIPQIRNRDNTDQCPMEKMADKTGSPEAFYKELESQIKIE